jgi:RimJ/RimL family protein N-acetyltransferase
MHTEIVSYADSTWWEPPLEIPHDCELRMLETFDAATPYLPAVSNAYGRDIHSEWQRYYEWGQTCALLLVGNEPAAFGWLQSGDQGAKCYYIQLHPGEFRAVRGAVLPEFRGQGLHAIRHQLMLEFLFARGASRVYLDCFEDNIASWKGHKRAGYRRFGRIRVFCPLGITEYVRWL